MFIKIPFESIIDFKTSIHEITKMSLEHDYNVCEGVVLGNFYVSGEYQAHAISINRDPFKHTLPFTVELRDDIDKDTVEFNIEDFSYEIIDNSKLKVNIVYSLQAEELVKEELFERVDESELESELTYIDDFLEEVSEDNIIEENEMPKELEKSIEINETKIVEDVPQERLNVDEEKTIMETIKDSDDTFVTYHIHILKESETIESVANLYNVSAALLNDYNDVSNATSGDKLLIPKIDE